MDPGRIPEIIAYSDGRGSLHYRSLRWSGAGFENWRMRMKTALLLACALGAVLSGASVEEPGFSVTVTASGLN